MQLRRGEMGVVVGDNGRIDRTGSNDPNPDNNSLADVKIGPVINTSGWTQTLLAAVPGR